MGDNVFNWRCSGLLRESRTHACDIVADDFVWGYVSDFLQMN